MKNVKCKYSQIQEVYKKFKNEIHGQCVSFKDSTLIIQIDDIVLVEYEMKTKLDVDLSKNILENKRMLFYSILEKVEETKFELDESHFAGLLALIFVVNCDQIMKSCAFYQEYKCGIS